MSTANGLRRVGAYLIDVVVIYVYIGVLFGASTALNAVWPLHEAMDASYGLRHAISFGTLTLPVVLYFVHMEHSRHRGTFGKRRLGLEVVAAHGGPAPLHSLAIRNAVKFLPWEMAHTWIHLHPGYLLSGPDSIADWMFGAVLPVGLMVVWVLLIFVRRDGRSVYELVSRTQVLRTA